MIIFITVPIGYIYYQLPNQSPPSSLWPHNIWTDISVQYSGLFFRTEGKQSKPFFETQLEDCPQLYLVESKDKYSTSSDVTLVRWLRTDTDHYLYVGGDQKWSKRSRIGLSFFVSDDEVRPKNTAIRIWKCIKRKSMERKLLWCNYHLAQFLNKNLPSNIY